jgi:hypothetical protein
MIHSVDIQTIHAGQPPVNRAGASRSFVMLSTACRVRSSVYGRGSGSKRESVPVDRNSLATTGGPVVRLSDTGMGVLWSTPGKSQPIGCSATPSRRRIPTLGPSVSGTMMIAGWIRPCPGQTHHRVSRPDSRTSHSTGIASRRGADVQSALQKTFGADLDPFATDRPKEAMDG